jgi:lipoprotein-anchoring transpeptidase ErfK/SrfK
VSSTVAICATVPAHVRTLAAMLAAATSLTSCGFAQHPDAANDTVPAVRHDENALLPAGRWIATAIVPEVDVYAEPKAATPTHRLAHPDANGTPLVLLVETGNADADWLPVKVPVRPNGTRGWVRSRDVTLTQTQLRIKVDLEAHRLTVYEGPRVRLTTAIGVGKDATPTPPGRYYVKELTQPPDPDTVYGPYVFGLSGFSDVVTSMNGRGEGRIGIHGNNDPSSIGGDVSSGCIRLPNDAITEMTRFVPLGTPVEIVRSR